MGTRLRYRWLLLLPLSFPHGSIFTFLLFQMNCYFIWACHLDSWAGCLFIDSPLRSSVNLCLNLLVQNLSKNNSTRNQNSFYLVSSRKFEGFQENWRVYWGSDAAGSDIMLSIRCQIRHQCFLLSDKLKVKIGTLCCALEPRSEATHIK